MDKAPNFKLSQCRAEIYWEFFYGKAYALICITGGPFIHIYASLYPHLRKVKIPNISQRDPLTPAHCLNSKFTGPVANKTGIKIHGAQQENINLLISGMNSSLNCILASHKCCFLNDASILIQYFVLSFHCSKDYLMYKFKTFPVP